jgi:hypothetical protein
MSIAWRRRRSAIAPVSSAWLVVVSGFGRSIACAQTAFAFADSITTIQAPSPPAPGFPRKPPSKKRKAQLFSGSLGRHYRRHAEAGQEDWEDLAGRLTFALNTSRDATRRETPFFLIHGWDAKTTMSAMLAPKPAGRAEKLHAYAWRIQVQRQYQHAQSAARDFQRKGFRV